MLSEIDRLRYENRALKERLQTFDIATGGFLEVAAKSMTTLMALSEELGQDPSAVASLSECIQVWADLVSEVNERVKALAPLPGAPSVN